MRGRPFVVPAALVVVALTVLARDARSAPLGTTPADFVQPGTQPSPAELDNFDDPALCAQCHGGFRPAGDAPSDAWATSMMAQAVRDPLMRAAAAIANADAAGSAETCIRCHAPVGWLGGRSTGGDFGNLEAGDLHGVTCHMCHRMLDPIAHAGAPLTDASILSALDQAGTRPNGRCAQNPGQPCTSDAACGGAGPCRVDAGQGRFVVDSDDARRGPRVLEVHAGHPTLPSSFHSRSDACAPCHDVSTPTFTRGVDGSWTLNALDAPHPTQDPAGMFPEQRTYSEWRASSFATEGVVFPDGRFGGTKTAVLPNTVAVSTCQDCHMADIEQKPCDPGTTHPDVGGHFFTGANTWVLGAVLDEYGAASGLTAPSVAAAAERTAAMLAAAADLEVTQVGYELTVRVVNQTGHKLPTGYPEGRRMWLGLKVFAGGSDVPIAEDGAYDATTATLDVAGTTKIYEVRQVIAPDVAALSGLAAGTPFHLVLNGAVELDNRIPPRGFALAAFDAFGGAPVGHTYVDGQYWDDTTYTLALSATRVEASLYYQTTSREYAEFLRDTAPDASGQNAYDRWVARGRSVPVVMDRVTLDLTPICTPDGSPCTDGNPCTSDEVCIAGACTGPTRPCPDDGNVCTDDVCASLTGECGVFLSGTCDDGDPCTENDACASGVCGGTTSGVAGARCMITTLASADVCTEPLPKGLRRFVDQRLRKAERLLARFERKRDGGASARVLDRILSALDRVFAGIGKRADRAERGRNPSRRISAPCAEVLGRLVARERDVLARLRS